MFEFQESPNGMHQIGGKKPTELQYPVNKFTGDFQYVGLLNRQDSSFNWLPFDLHLICPIYLNIDKVFLNYTDPSKPKLIHPIDTEAIDSEYDELKADSYIEFESIKVELQKVKEIDDLECIGIAGKPMFVQDLDIPICPINKKKMKFVCQLMTFGEISTKEKNFDSDYPDFEHMCFWGDGSLFVFMEPESKTVCYFIQHT